METGTGSPAQVKQRFLGRYIVEQSESEMESSWIACKPFREQYERMLLDGYESDSEPEYDFGDPLMSEEDWAAYWRQINESEGFEADLYLGCYDWEDSVLGVIQPASVEENHDEFKKIIELAIEKQGKTNKIVLERIVKGNVQALAPCVYYITFEAKDMNDDGGGLIKTYQTKVVLQIPDEYTSVEIFREKPVQC